MPKEVYLSSLDGTVAGGASGGGSGLRGAVQSPAIELKGCTKSQPAVAGLMSRMRNVEGVTRVTLAKSDKDSGATGTSASNVNPCGKGNPPSFEMVIFFERSAVASALTSVTGATDPADAGKEPTAAETGAAAGKSSSTTNPPASQKTSTPAATPGGTP